MNEKTFREQCTDLIFFVDTVIEMIASNDDHIFSECLYSSGLLHLLVDFEDATITQHHIYDYSLPINTDLKTIPFSPVFIDSFDAYLNVLGDHHTALKMSFESFVQTEARCIDTIALVANAGPCTCENGRDKAPSIYMIRHAINLLAALRNTREVLDTPTIKLNNENITRRLLSYNISAPQFIHTNDAWDTENSIQELKICLDAVIKSTASSCHDSDALMDDTSVHGKPSSPWIDHAGDTGHGGGHCNQDVDQSVESVSGRWPKPVPMSSSVPISNQASWTNREAEGFHKSELTEARMSQTADAGVAGMPQTADAPATHTSQDIVSDDDTATDGATKCDIYNELIMEEHADVRYARDQESILWGLMTDLNELDKTVSASTTNSMVVNFDRGRKAALTASLTALASVREKLVPDYEVTDVPTGPGIDDRIPPHLVGLPDTDVKRIQGKVTELVNAATSPYNLCKMFDGWLPWM
eukprot:GHVO01047641.1.p1 GENE.GHVO01047641.1~~GHVO01047641.1.p1  ORF type:complete len:501 (-),score=85.38 GHVO01047641.1:131-1546(-)